MFYVYVYSDPTTGVPFYVGKGSGRRARKHLFETWDNTTNKSRLSKVLSIRANGSEPQIDIVAKDLTEFEALSIEASLIHQYGKIIDGSGTLTNVLDGGAQPPKGVGNPDWKTHNPSTTMQGVPYEERYGVARAAEIRKARSMSSLGRKFSPATRQRMQTAAINRPPRTYLHKRVVTPDGTFDTCSACAAFYQISAPTVSYRLKHWETWNSA